MAATPSGLLEELEQVGYLVRDPAGTRVEGAGRWRIVPQDGRPGCRHPDGTYYFALDVSGMVPLYREIYRGILAERIRLAGIGGATGAVLVDGLVVGWGSDDAMRDHEPSGAALRRLEQGDGAWAADLDHRWRGAARDLLEATTGFWAQLCDGRVDADDFRALVAAKVSLGALAVDSLLPPRSVVERWIGPHVDASLVEEVVGGCFLPGSGYVAYDELEDECWRLAEALLTHGCVPESARTRFLGNGLFFLYDTLYSVGTDYYFRDYPREVAAQYARVASGLDDVAVRRRAISQRSWRRRLHRSWAEEQVSGIDDRTERDRLLVVHVFIGSGRDFDEAKRRLNRELWRCLVALTDALGMSLTDPGTGLDALCRRIESLRGSVTIDAALRSMPGPR